MEAGGSKPSTDGQGEVAGGAAWSAADFLAVRKTQPHLLDPWSPAPMQFSGTEEKGGHPEVSAPIPGGEAITCDAAQMEGRTGENGRLQDLFIQEEVAEPTARTTDWTWTIASGALRARQPKPTIVPSDWALLALLPGFQPDARENPFIVPLKRPTAEDIGAKRARWLVSLLDVPEARRRRNYIRLFEQLFATHEHYATYQALSKLALDEQILAETLVESCRFRQAFLERQDWWAVRYGCGISYAAAGQSLMGWRRALKFVRMCGGDPSGVIDDDWFIDWLELPYGDPSRLRFVDYLEARLILHRQACGSLCGSIAGQIARYNGSAETACRRPAHSPEPPR